MKKKGVKRKSRKSSKQAPSGKESPKMVISELGKKFFKRRHAIRKEQEKKAEEKPKSWWGKLTAKKEEKPKEAPKAAPEEMPKKEPDEIKEAPKEPEKGKDDMEKKAEESGKKIIEAIKSKTKRAVVEKTKVSKQDILESYTFNSANMPIAIRIYRKKGEFVPIYDVYISSISKNTEIILERIRKELVRKVSLGMVDITEIKRAAIVEEKFSETIFDLVKRYFPDADDKTSNFLATYLIHRSLGLGKIEILNDDPHLEEIAINNAEEPVWVYHRKYGWLKSNIMLDNEEQIRHYSTMIGRKVGRSITVLSPLMDAHLGTGDRVNATLNPISYRGNTITLRKFAAKPWTITSFLREGTISYEAAALIWEAVHYELSVIISGGTASGKTSMLNVVSNFFPPNQRVLSIEDTREIQLPSFLHWIPMVTRLPNPEGKGAVTMLDLLVNSLRQRPDRIVVGEIRRKKEAEVLFEAIHTGHSVYATVHANDVDETITRLTNPPIDIPKSMLPAVSMVVVQYRNRRTGNRRTFQVAEILPNAESNVLKQYDIRKDKLVNAGRSKVIATQISTFAGLSKSQFSKEIKEKERVLKWLVKQKVDTVEEVGRIIAEYYTNRKNLMKHVKSGRKLL